MIFRRFLPAALGLALLATPGAVTAAPMSSATPDSPSPAAARPAAPVAPTVHVFATLGSCGLAGTATGIGAFTLEHRTAKGKLKASSAVTVSAGSWSVDCPGPRLVGGDRLRFIGAGPAPFRTFIVPQLRLTTDRSHDRVTGTAPGVAHATLVLVSCDAARVGCTALPDVSVPVSSSTHGFSYHSPDDITGTWSANLQWVKSGDQIEVIQRVAQLVIKPGSSVVVGTGRRPGDVAAVSVRRGDVIGLAAPHTRSDASFTAHIKLHGAPMSVRKGDVISSSIAGDAVFTMPAASIALTVDGVAGRCFKHAHVSVVTLDAIGGFQGWSTPAADETGRWSLTTVLSAGWSVDAYCANAQGDLIKLHVVSAP